MLAFDEFHVSDIADAMILGRLLELMIAKGVVLVMTSNYKPDDLYPNGLQRARFLPAIEILKRDLDVVELGGRHRPSPPPPRRALGVLHAASTRTPTRTSRCSSRR